MHDSDADKRIGEAATKTRKDDESDSDTELPECCICKKTTNDFKKYTNDYKINTNEKEKLKIYKCVWDPALKTSRLRNWCKGKYPNYSKITQFEPNEGCGNIFCEEHISTLAEHTDTRDLPDEEKYHLCLGCSEKEHTIACFSEDKLYVYLFVVLAFIVLCSPALFYDSFKETWGDGNYTGRNHVNPCVGTYRSNDRDGTSPYWQTTKNTHPEDPTAADCYTP